MRKLTSLAAAAMLTAQVPVPGPQVLTFLSSIDDSDQPYALYLPKDYSPGKKYPLVVSLHGAYSNHRLNLRRVFGLGNRVGETDAQATRYFPPLPDVSYIVASPLARGTLGYQHIAEKDVYDVLEDVKRRFPIDPDRTYLTGLSMGGGGTLWIGLTRPDVWAALAPVCPYPPPGTDELAANALNLPVKLFQGAIDPVVPAAGTRQWHERLRTAGVAADYVEYPGVRHNSWDYAYKDAAIFDWFSKHRRNAFPDRVRFSTRDYEHSSAYWVRFDRLTPGNLASIDARIENKRLIIDTDELDGFTLQLKGHPAYRASLPLLIDGTPMKLTGPAASFRRTAKGWTPGVAAVAPSEKRKGLEGPISAVFSTRHVYVYGAKAQDARALAERAARWAEPRLPLLLNPPVVNDRDPGLGDGSLILFGNRENNALIEKYSDRLPLHLNPGAADYGLLYIYPVDGRYIVISSGLPWWTRIDQSRRGGATFLPPLYRLLSSLGDFILFRGGIDDVVAEGHFDRNWKLPPEALANIRATGAVEVRQ